MMRFLYIGLVAGVFSFGFKTEDIKKEASEDFARIRDAYNNLTAVSMNIKYGFYASYSDEKPIEQHTAFYCKQGKENSKMELYGTLTITNKNVVMVKDDSSLIFLLNNYNETQMPQLTHEQFKQMLEICSSVEKLQPKEENFFGYKLSFKGNMNGVKKIELYFSKKTFFVNKMFLYYDRPVEKSHHSKEELDYPKPKLEVEYVNVNMNPSFEKNTFSVGKYLKKENEKWQLTAPFASSYELYDHTFAKLK